MDPFQPFSAGGSSPRSLRELQGPRPAPLRVRKDSHKVRKPPLAPPPSQQHTLPLIIYTISPKVIHTNPDDFMTLVQRLTGADRPTTSATFNDNNGGGGLISPAARYAVMDKISSYQPGAGGEDHFILGSSSISSNSSSSRQFIPTSILSPGPSSLTPVAPTSFFSPLSSDPNSMSSFFQGLSPVMNQGNKNINFMELGPAAGASTAGYQQLIPSPGSSNYSNLFLSPSIISPSTYSLDLFNNFCDL